MHCNQKNEDLIWFNKQITRLLCFLQCPTCFSRRKRKKERKKKHAASTQPPLIWWNSPNHSDGGVETHRTPPRKSALEIFIAQHAPPERHWQHPLASMCPTRASWFFILIILYIYQKTQSLLNLHENYEKSKMKWQKYPCIQNQEFNFKGHLSHCTVQKKLKSPKCSLTYVRCFFVF
jgi:hypothetical protein